MGILDADPTVTSGRAGQTVIADKHYYGPAFEGDLAADGLTLLRPARAEEKPRPGAHLLEPLRQVIEAIIDTFEGQLDLGDRVGGYSVEARGDEGLAQVGLCVGIPPAPSERGIPDGSRALDPWMPLRPGAARTSSPQLVLLPSVAHNIANETLAGQLPAPTDPQC